jgi:hypothetical protein
MKLNLQPDNLISLPDWIGATQLSLSEIGAVVCLACLGEGDEGTKRRIQTKEFQSAVKSLGRRGMIQPLRDDDGTVRIEIDLDVIAP